MLENRVAEILAPGGRLSRRWPHYEHRDGQQSLAADIARTLEHGGILAAEAPTGIGKSLAYLLPSALLAAEQGRRVAIATCTRSLQDQLFERDVPGLLDALDLRLAAVRLKGKQNYLCPRLLDLAEPHGADETVVLERLRRWAEDDLEGDLDRFPSPDAEVFRRLRARVCAEPDACSIQTCRRGRECPWVAARRRAAQAQLLIVNHALLAISGEVEGLLPEFDVLIVDEAHRLEGVLLSQLERSVSRNRFEEALRLVGSGRSGARAHGGLLARLRAYALPLIEGRGEGTLGPAEIDAVQVRIPECRRDAERLFALLAPDRAGHPLYGARDRYRTGAEIFGRDLAPLEIVLGHCAEFSRALRRFGAAIEGMSAGAAAEELVAELEQVGAHWSMLGADLEALGDPSDPGWVYWRSAGNRGVELHGAPIHAGAEARRLVLGRARSVVLTSATLSSGGDFEFMAERLGLGESWNAPFEIVSRPSPFPLERQMRSFVFDGGGDEASAIANLAAELSQSTDRNQLVLFTAHERLRRAREQLIARVGSDRVVLAQEWDGPASLVTERFRLERGAILLGVQSLWEGVDFPGETLEIVVVARLPFSVPDDPRVEARGERLRERGFDPFQHDAVPEAVLRFRQGVGRLIRRADDRGVLVVCDPRLVTATYRNAFLEALPGPPRVMRNARELALEAARFLSGEVAMEETS